MHKVATSGQPRSTLWFKCGTIIKGDLNPD